jgi:hypothetical protein
VGPRVAAAFDWLEARWEGPRALRIASGVLVAGFVIALAAVELARRDLLPAGMAARVPRNHLRAIEVAFYLLLSYEVVGLVFGIASSVSRAAGKQLEIFSLILLRHAFEVFGQLAEPVQWADLRRVVPEMLSDATGALAIFVVLAFYYRACRHQPAPSAPADRRSFIVAKKGIALLLLAAFAALGARALWSQLVLHASPHGFFEGFYTLLIFADILVVLMSMRYSSSYPVVFRNSGLTVATVLLRVGLAAPAFFNAALGLAAALFALALTLAYNRHAPAPAPGSGASPAPAPPAA